MVELKSHFLWANDWDWAVLVDFEGEDFFCSEPVVRLGTASSGQPQTTGPFDDAVDVDDSAASFLGQVRSPAVCRNDAFAVVLIL